MRRFFVYIRVSAVKALISVLVFMLSFSTYGFMRQVQAIRATSTSFIIPVSELTSIAGRSTSTSFISYSAGGQQATGISTSTSFKLWSGILYALFGEAATGSPSAISVSGTVYSDEGVTTATSTVVLAVEGSTSYSTSTNSSGAYIFTDVAQPADSDVMTVWLGADPELEQSRSEYTTDGVLAYSSNVATSNLLVVFVQEIGNVNNIGITDTLSNTWSSTTLALSAGQQSSNISVRVFYAITTAGGANTITLSGLDADPGMYIYEFSGIDTANPFDSVASSSGSAANTTNPTTTITTAARSLIVAHWGTETDGQTSISASSTFTIGQTQPTHGAGQEYDVLSAGTHTVPFLLDPGSDDWTLGAIAFKAGSSGIIGNTVTRYTSSVGNITGLDIYKDRLITRHEDSGPLTNSDLGVCDSGTGSVCGTTALRFNEASGALTVQSDTGLYLWGGDTFTPGGAVTLSNGAATSTFGGDIKWASSTSVLSISTNALSVGGDFKNAIGGTFTTGSGQTTTFTATTTGFTIDSGGQPFKNVIFNGSGGEWSANSSTLVIGSTSTIHHLTMATGTLSNSFGTSSIIVHNGSATGTGGVISLTNSTFTMSLIAATSTSFGSTAGAWTFYNLAFTTGSTTAGTYTFNQETSGTGNNTISNLLNISAGTTTGVNATLVAGNRTWTLSGTTGAPFTLTNNSGTADLDSASSTFSYTGNNTGGNTTITSETYWTLAQNGNPGETFVLGGDVTTNNNFTFNGSLDTFDTTGATLTVNGSYGHTAGTISGTGNITAKGGITFGVGSITNLTGGTFEHRPSANVSITISPAQLASTTFYNLKMNNASSSSILAVYSMNSGFVVSNDWTLGDNSSSTYIFRRNSGVSAILDIDNDLTIGADGQLEASTNQIRIARNFTAAGTLVASSSTFVFDTTATSTITGTSTELIFNSIGSAIPNKTLVFATSTPSYRVDGLLTLQGTASTTPVFVESNSSGTQWNINHQGTEAVEFISLKDSGCVSTSTDITVTDATSTSIDRGNNDNPCWLINDPVTGITVSGTVYSDEGVTTATSSVKLAVGSSTGYTTSTDSSGAYTFTAVTQPTTSTVLTVWMDNGGGGNGTGAMVTLASGTAGNITGLDIYKNYLITRHEDAGPLTSTNLSLCDKTTGSACADSDLHFEVTTSTSALTVDNDWGLYLWGGDTFTPGGAVTLSAGSASSTAGGDLKWASSTSVLDIASNALSVGGDWYNQIGGTFTKGSTSTVTFTATQSGMRIVPSSSQTFANLTFNGSGGTWSATNTTTTVNGSVTMTAGTINNTMGNARWVINDGDVTGTSGAFSLTTSTLTMDQNGSSTRSFGATGANWTLNNVVMRNISTSSPAATFAFVSGGTVTTTFSGTFTIGNTDPLVQSTVIQFGSSSVELAYNGTNPIVMNAPASISHESSTVTYTGNSAGGNTNVIAPSAYWNLAFNNVAETYDTTQPVSVLNDYNLNAGTFLIGTGSLGVTRDLVIATSGVLTADIVGPIIGRNLSNLGTFNTGSSTVQFNTSATSTITSTSTLTFWSLDSQVAGKQLNFGAGQTFVVLGNLTLGGSTSSPLLIDSTASGTQWLINHQGAETITNTISLKDSGCSATSTYITVNYVNAVDRGNNGSCWLFPSLSLSISPLSINLSLGDTNTFSQNATNTLTVTTNATFGYNAYAYATDLLRKIAGTSTTIANWTGTNASPTAWTTTCIGSATCGFGYNTNDADLTQFDSTKYAGFTTSTPGDIVAQATATTTNEITTMTYRASVDRSQEAGDYQTTIRYIIAPRF